MRRSSCYRESFFPAERTTIVPAGLINNNLRAALRCLSNSRNCNNKCIPIRMIFVLSSIAALLTFYISTAIYALHVRHLYLPRTIYIAPLYDNLYLAVFSLPERGSFSAAGSTYPSALERAINLELNIRRLPSAASLARTRNANTRSRGPQSVSAARPLSRVRRACSARSIGTRYDLIRGELRE